MRLSAPLPVVLALLGCGGGRAPDPIPTPGAQKVDCSNVHAGSECDLGCASGATCDFNCDGFTLCDAGCSGGSKCGVVDCRGSTACDVQCSGGSSCGYIDCQHTTGCEPNCSGGSRCDINCDGVTNCSVTCSGGSPCLVLCADATCSPHTQFADCSGGSGTVSCPQGMIACNRACPSCGDGVCDRIAGETCSNCPHDCAC
jgi:hypothetical protein